MKILLCSAVGLALFFAFILLVGTRLPMRHRARVELRVAAAPDRVYTLVSDVGDTPAWRKDVKSVELLAPEGGMPRFRESGAHGEIIYRIEAAQPPRRFATRIASSGLGYGGAWTWEILPDSGGTRVTITEDGEVTSPLFRFMSRYLFGHYGSMETYLRALATALGETARPQRLPE